MAQDVLLLNADYTPLRVIPWQRAVALVLEGTARQVTDYAGRLIRSMELELPWPAVVALVRYHQARERIKFSRANVLARDGYTCAYCGVKPRRSSGRPALEELTLDHVIPRAQAVDGRVRLAGGREAWVTSWVNVVTACMPCNAVKADRTPDQAGMALRIKPRKPGHLDIVRMSLTRYDVPDEWKDYLPRGSGWQDYWDGELDRD